MSGRDESTNPFSLLADETRLGIVEAIGDRSGDGEYASLSYSTIQTALGEVDSGRLNYHLRQLEGRFVEHTDDGYRLLIPGIRVYQAVTSGQLAADRPTVPPTEIDSPCGDCGDPLFVSYEEGRVFVRCPTCDVTYHRYPLSPSAFDPGDAASLADAGLTVAFADLRSMLAGVCPYCSGVVECTLSADDRGDLGLEGPETFAHLTCSTCGWFNHPQATMATYLHHTTAVFYERHGRAAPHSRLTVEGEWSETVRSTDPWRVEVRVTLDGDTLRHVVDENLDVVEWEVDGWGTTRQRPAKHGRRAVTLDRTASTASGESPFSLLADETRLGIVEAIGDRSGDGEYASLSYSEVRAALDGVDTGNLNYHLRKLRGRFVERTDDGYRLLIPGIRMYQAVASGQFAGDRPTVPPTEVDSRCEGCEEPVQVAYEDGRFFVRCPTCEVTQIRYPLSPNAVDPTDVDGLVSVAMTKIHLDLRSMLDGLCPYCSGAVHHDVSTADRGDLGLDERDAFAHLTCSTCGWFNHPAVEMVAFHHHATEQFYEERGRPGHYTRPNVDGELEVTVESEDPWRIEVRVTLDGDTLRHVVDGDLDVVEWEVVD
ncbi:helix-turn-helix domain-containing protein [Halomarina salina]|uniref:Helix-turn-helix domain-containing protein n=1 Tax=Halomarina salina TaxID=1872699 RepID=A0ABD5RPF1_9EURY|nr:helix-turn-helix domain-containing protein [Halomarina salina]